MLSARNNWCVQINKGHSVDLLWPKDFGRKTHVLCHYFILQITTGPRKALRMPEYIFAASIAEMSRSLFGGSRFGVCFFMLDLAY